MVRRSVIILLLLIPAFACAEHLFEAGIHAGAAGRTGQPVYVDKQTGLHIGGHLYYSCLSSHVVGLRTGLTIDNHQTGFGKRDYADSYSALDVDNQQMDISYTIGNLHETFSIWSVGVPMQAVFSYKGFTLYAGAKAVFPMAGSWKQAADNAALSVYYPAYDNRVEESYPLAASRDFRMDQTGRMTLPKTQWWLALEFNYALPLNTWAVHYRSYLMVGACFDYCFTRLSPADSNAESLIMLTDTRDGLPLQRLMAPLHEANRQGSKLIGECNLFSVGVKISYAIAPYDAHREAKRACRCLQDEL